MLDMKSIRQAFLALCGIILLESCVSLQKYDALRDACDAETATLKGRLIDLEEVRTEHLARIDKLNGDVMKLKQDTARLGIQQRNSLREYESLTKTYQSMLANTQNMLEGSESEHRRLMSDLQQALGELQQREDALRLLDQKMEEKSASLIALEQELASKEIKMKEMERILFEKDSLVNDIREKVSRALLGFTEKGLNIRIINGKVYVSMDETLLFRSGSWEVNKDGREAIIKLAKVLEENPDITILVEGHTDDVPYNGTGQVKDNWDLSVMRATAVVRIIVANSKVNPERLTASGRSEYIPVEADKSAAARQKNRRTEIILTPKLDELFRIIETN